MNKQIRSVYKLWILRVLWILWLAFLADCTVVATTTGKVSGDFSQLTVHKGYFFVSEFMIFVRKCRLFRRTWIGVILHLREVRLSREIRGPLVDAWSCLFSIFNGKMPIGVYRKNTKCIWNYVIFYLIIIYLYSKSVQIPQQICNFIWINVL